LIRFQLLGRRNTAYGVSAAFIFLVITQSATTVPLQYLQQVQGLDEQQHSASPVTEH
jgi:DHA2 family multidrug resistance protein